MEELTKSQIMLLTLLVSFVTSIATGIVTVSLMDQAPPAIAQTVNRVIERTIETVAPASQAAGAAVTRERTVVVRESELISQAVTKITPSVVRLYTNASETATLLGLGVVLNSGGEIAADASVLGEAEETTISLSDGTRLMALVSSRDIASGIVFLQATTTGTTTVQWKPAVLAGNTPILGQTIVALSGKSVLRVEDGIVTALLPALKDNPNVVIDTTVSEVTILPGSPLINSDGEVLGVSTAVSRTSSKQGFIASSALMKKPVEEEAPKGE